MKAPLLALLHLALHQRALHFTGKRYIYDFASILANALITIHKDKVQTEAELASALDVSPVLTDYLLQILEERKFL